MSEKRLLLLTTEFPPGPGGIGTHAMETARWLSRYGWRVRVRGCQDYTSAAEAECFNRALGCEVRTLRQAGFRGHRAGYLVAGALTDTVRWRPNVLLATGRKAVWSSAICAKVKRIPVAAVAHGTELTMGSRTERRLTGWAFRAADAVISVSRYTAAQVERLGVNRSRIVVIPNGAEDATVRTPPEGTDEEIRQRLGLGRGPAVLTVGNVTRRKGQEVVIRALREVATVMPEVEYWVAGLPSERDRLEAIARDCDVSTRVKFLGRVEPRTLAWLYSNCSVFAMTSQTTAEGDYEGYGIAVAEAAMHGKPAVVTDCGGLPEAVINGETGYVAREGDVDGVAQVLTRLLCERELREEMGRQAQARVLREGTWATRMREYDRVLSELL